MLMAPVGIASIGWIGALLAEAHDRPLAELFFDLADGQIDGLDAFAVLAVVPFNLRHSILLVERGYSKDVPSESQAY